MDLFVLWVALITVLVFVVALSSKAPHHVAELSGMSLAWVAVFGLAWHRCTSRMDPGIV